MSHNEIKRWAGWYLKGKPVEILIFPPLDSVLKISIDGTGDLKIEGDSIEVERIKDYPMNGAAGNEQSQGSGL